ncbi:DUF5677 domain-containing protein [Bradyrhizobium sp. Ash2021]|uniref:DUF5677 domain-containing protein n=1 Tax=Bradyrhizobium sp. Ash2021 TaxID=2954771 RepID=UPI00281601F1|nr:DUF5677 domain-containing protein [Bradyrhizobium sp. Ash2021]WMT71915.1 DUF5677 domain-containing protein [Bradyrhizobium sp. Ash2021]
MTASEGPFPVIERVAVNPAAIAAYTREWDFMILASELLREVTSYVCVAACTLGSAPAWTRDQAAVGGNMVRLSKLLSSYLDQIVQKRYETSTILSRLAFETIVNARYLIANFAPELVDSFVRHSLRHERGLRDKIQANIQDRGGDILHIEQRMLKSIERAARIAGLTLDDVDLKDRTPWGGKNLRQKAEAIGFGEAYRAMFGGMSHNVHGSWHDLYQFHLEADENGGFTPNLDWGRPRPQPLFALGHLALYAVRDFLTFIGGETAMDQLREQLRDLGARIDSVNQAHEAYLSGKTWPAI